MPNKFEIYTEGYHENDDILLQFAIDLALVETHLYAYTALEWKQYSIQHRN